MTLYNYTGTIMKHLKEGTEPPRGNPFAPEEEEKKEEEVGGVNQPQMIIDSNPPSTVPDSLP